MAVDKMTLDFMYEDEMYVGLDVCRQNDFRLNVYGRNAYRPNA